MNYTQPHRQYKVNVLTDSPYTDQLPPDAITDQREHLNRKLRFGNSQKLAKLPNPCYQCQK